MTLSLIVKTWYLLILGLFPGATDDNRILLVLVLKCFEDSCCGLSFSRVDILGPFYNSLVILVSHILKCALGCFLSICGTLLRR